MPEQLANFPFWLLEFDKDAQPVAGVDTFRQELPAAGLTDLFVFSHGWNNNRTAAMKLYAAFFGEVRKIVDNPAVAKKPGTRIGVAGVLWPSILFPGDAGAPYGEGGAASFHDDLDAPTLASELPKVFNQPEQQPLLRELLTLVEERAPDRNALLEFRDRLSALMGPPATASTQDDLERRAATVKDDDDWFALLDTMSAPTALDDSGGGAASIGGFFGKLWNGALNVLRIGTFWEMKNRAGVVGKEGLGPLLRQVHSALPALRIHLLGHSFGARLVSYTLAGLGDDLVGPASPVKSLFLLQGAFSHFAFADRLPFDANRSGDLAGRARHVDGPLLTTFSLKDLAVGNAYPAAALLNREDALASTDLLYRWEGMGYDGAQAVDADGDTLGAIDTAYAFAKGKWLNLDGNRVIVKGDPPSGAHGDIVHEETAWAALAAAQIGIPAVQAKTGVAGGT